VQARASRPLAARALRHRLADIRDTPNRYRVPHAGSVEATLIAVQEHVLMSGDYIWPWDIDPDYPGEDEDEAVPRPSSLARLAAAKETEEFRDEGTHTILDIDRVITVGDGYVGAIFLVDLCRAQPGVRYPAAVCGRL
jgi:hypothetical protein